MNASKENIVRVSAAEARLMKGETDYARLDAMTDADIARAVAEDPDAAPLDIDWDKASLVIPPTAKDVITLRLDHDVLEWLRSTGPGYQTRINKVLRAWYEQSARREQAKSERVKLKVPKFKMPKLPTGLEKKPATHRTFAKAVARKTPAKRASR
jgi:uncharacterized protein (DUF4415 family)